MPSGFTPDAIWVSDLNVRKVDSDPGATTAIRNTTAGLSRVKSELDILIDQGLEATSVRTSSASPITALVGELVRLNANGAITVNAPAPASLAEGEIFGIQVVTGDPGANNITVARNGHSTINEVAASLVLDSKGTFTFRRAGTDLVVESSAPLMLAVDDAGAADGYVLSRVAGAPAWVSPTAGGNVSKVGTPVNNQLGVWTGDGTVEGDANLTWDGGTATFVYRSTDAGPTTGPVVKLYRDSATPANDDILGEIRFDGEDDAGNTTTYAKIRSEAAVVTNGAETARIYFQMALLGTDGNARDFVKFGPDTDVAVISPLDGTGSGPSLILYRNSPTPAPGDAISQILFRGQDSGNTFDDYAQIKCGIVDHTASTEDGKLDFLVMVNGTPTTKLSLTGTTTIYEAGGTDVALADGGTGSSTAGGARTNLGLVIGTDVLAFAGTGLPDEIGGHIETVANKTYVLGLKAAYGYTVNALAAKTASGTCTAKLTIDGVDVTGIAALSVSSTEASATASAANVVGVDTTLALVVSANSAALDLSFSVKITR